MSAKKEKRPKKIVFVCTGNTCRSPMAEQIFKYVLKKKRKLSLFDVCSAGLSVADGDEIADNALFALKELGVKAERTASRQLTQELFDRADMIVCMTAGHKAALPASGKVFTVGELTGGGDVDDPFGREPQVYLAAARYLLYACQDVLRAAEALPEKEK